jgi:hypothetical protein
MKIIAIERKRRRARKKAVREGGREGERSGDVWQITFKDGE